MKCVYGKFEPSWDIRITCNSKDTKMAVYEGLKFHLANYG